MRLPLYGAVDMGCPASGAGRSEASEPLGSTRSGPSMVSGRQGAPERTALPFFIPESHSGHTTGPLWQRTLSLCDRVTLLQAVVLGQADELVELVEGDHVPQLAGRRPGGLQLLHVALHGLGRGVERAGRVEGDAEAERLEFRGRQERRAAALDHVRQRRRVGESLIDPPQLIHAFGALDEEHVGPGLLVRRSEEHTSELQSRQYLVCRLLLEKKKLRPNPLRHFYPLVIVCIVIVFFVWGKPLSSRHPSISSKR